MQDIRVAAVSTRSEFGDSEGNLSNILEWIDRAAAEKAELVCFPEAALQGYPTDEKVVRDLAEPLDGPACRAVTERCRRHALRVGLGMIQRDGERVHNAYVFFDPDGAIGASHKMHLAGCDLVFDPVIDWPVFDLGRCRVGAVICNDVRFVESTRILAIRGAEIVIMPFAGGRIHAGKLADPLDWPAEITRWVPSRAEDNGVFLVVVNHAGDVPDPRGIADVQCAHPDGLHRWPGYSFVVAPDGKVTGESDRTHNRERMLVVDLSAAHREKTRRNEIDTRRPQTYGALVE